MKKSMLFLLLILSLRLFGNDGVETQRPNVIFILTDDQGIGDLGCHGNPWLKTPNIDEFYEESVRMTDYHVSPLCTPTRSALMTGQYPINNGAWATFKGRDALSEDAKTVADVFKENGYKTALFGKWHLGDNYPTRPTDCGFEVAIHHLAGGIGELSDYWGNSYFDDVFYVNNEPKQFEGYCTDVWFTEAMKFIEKSKDEPFFIYLPLNAPHDPLIVEEKYAAPYKELEDKQIVSANLYGMIANIDENFGKFRKFLQKNKLEENTILIFMSDNGTRFGYSKDGTLGYNQGWRGIKGSKLEGGHRVPFFLRWPHENIVGGRDVDVLTAHVDVLPTLAGLCGISVPSDMPVDGVDFSEVLKNSGTIDKRSVFVHHRQDWRPPFDVDQTCIMKDSWRLINGSKLYDISEDPQQTEDLSKTRPDVLSGLLAENDQFIKASKENLTYYELPVHVAGHPAQEEIKLTVQHAAGEDRGIWKTEQVSSGVKSKNNTHALSIHHEGWYEIACRRWPKECPGPMWGIPEINPKNLFDYQTIRPEKVRIRIANQILEKEVNGEESSVTFRTKLPKGKSLLVTDFIEGQETYGVYYTYVKWLGN
ncbi:MAG: arylsulfatase [Bacteroidota bacterium]